MKSSAREVLEVVVAMKEEQKLKCYALWLCWSIRKRIREGEQGRGQCGFLIVCKCACRNGGSKKDMLSLDLLDMW
jgi:hypothetical protein